MKPYNESSINEIKMAAPFGSEKNSGREHIPQTICSDRESSNFDELRMCNEIIDNLKSECANLELTVVEQRTEIQGLQNRIKNFNYSENLKNTSAAVIDKREADCLINRLKEELRASQSESELTKQQVKQSATVISNL